MKRSTDRILTTFTGSLPRPPDLVPLLYARAHGASMDVQVYERRVQDAVDAAVRQQVEIGLDIVSDGEMGKTGFVDYVTQRLTGFNGQAAPWVPPDYLAHPDLLQRMQGGEAAQSPPIAACNGPITLRDTEAVHRDITRFQKALEGVPFEEAFMTAASPGTIAELPNSYYPSQEAYLYALADAMRPEYQAIVDAGFLLQVDCPDLAMGRHFHGLATPIDQFRQEMLLNIEVLTHALSGIPPECIRVHACYGNYPGTHEFDSELSEILDILVQVPGHALSLEVANPRHQWEWTVLQAFVEEGRWPAEKLLIPGVIDTVTNHIEHPRTVAQRIVLFAKMFGREKIVAGSDCGFGTFASFSAIAPSVAWGKLQALTEGAKLASQQLWEE